MIIKESELKYLVNKITESLNFSGIKSKKTAINYLYNITTPYTSKLYSDEYWSGVSQVKRVIGSVDGVTDVSIYVENGGYRENSEGTKWKEYKLEIETIQGFNICGILNAHAAGTIEDPFSSYDVTVNFW